MPNLIFFCFLRAISCGKLRYYMTHLTCNLSIRHDKHATVTESMFFFLTFRCGSLIVDLSLKFSSIVTETWVVDKLKEATKGRQLGGISVNTSSIQGTQAFILPTTQVTFSRPNESSPEGNFSSSYNPSIINC